ncbi:HYC_CC_PP family protein [Chitinophaga sp. CCNWLW40]|uniref:HYC_CC_PP family protein n=1 Tax=unclassified Chitinophaga TaxID=2619133 RepID=UPI0038B39F0E
MKKLFAIFLVVVYTNVALGVAINFHYCCGHLAKISILNFGDKNGCGCNPEGTLKGCCKDKMHIAKTDNHKISVLQLSFVEKPILYTAELPPVNNYSCHLVPERTIPYHIFCFVKRSSPQPIFLLVQVFRI